MEGNIILRNIVLTYCGWSIVICPTCKCISVLNQRLVLRHCDRQTTLYFYSFRCLAISCCIIVCKCNIQIEAYRCYSRWCNSTSCSILYKTVIERIFCYRLNLIRSCRCSRNSHTISITICLTLIPLVRQRMTIDVIRQLCLNLKCQRFLPIHNISCLQILCNYGIIQVWHCHGEDTSCSTWLNHQETILDNINIHRITINRIIIMCGSISCVLPIAFSYWC